MTFNRFAAGRKVYASGSYAPSRGANKRRGYINREVRRKNVKRMKINRATAQRAFAVKLRRMK